MPSRLLPWHDLLLSYKWTSYLHSQVTSRFGRAYQEAPLTLTGTSKCHHSQVLSLTLASAIILKYSH